ncbi:hypothetical protein STEG23_026070, partial [Scotinomys teguina]
PITVSPPSLLFSQFSPLPHLLFTYSLLVVTHRLGTAELEEEAPENEKHKPCHQRVKHGVSICADVCTCVNRYMNGYKFIKWMRKLTEFTPFLTIPGTATKRFIRHKLCKEMEDRVKMR